MCRPELTVAGKASSVAGNEEKQWRKHETVRERKEMSRKLRNVKNQEARRERGKKRLTHDVVVVRAPSRLAGTGGARLRRHSLRLEDEEKRQR